MGSRRRWALMAVVVVAGGTIVSVAQRDDSKRSPAVELAAPAFSELPIPMAPPERPPDPPAPVAVTETPTTSNPVPTSTAPRPAVRPLAAPRPAKAPRPGPSPLRPVRIEVPSIGAFAAIDPLGLNRDGSLAVPKDFRRAGYYTGRALPGEIGPAVIVAHVGSRSGPAVFARLSEIRPGAEVLITRADGSRIVFVVDRLERHPKNAFPTQAVYGPTPDATLRLITCGGTFDESTGHHRDNYIAFAHLRGPG